MTNEKEGPRSKCIAFDRHTLSPPATKCSLLPGVSISQTRCIYPVLVSFRWRDKGGFEMEILIVFQVTKISPSNLYLIAT